MPSSARTSAPLAGGGAGIPFGMNIVSSGSDPLDLDHAPPVLARDRDERGRPARDHRAVGEPAQRLALVGPGVLVRDDHRHAGQAADRSCPTGSSRTCGRAARPRARGAGAGTAATTPRPGGRRCASGRSPARRLRAGPRARSRRAAWRSPRRSRGWRHSVRSKRSGSSRVVVWIASRSAPPVPEPVDQRHDPQLAVVAAGGGHAANIMPQRPGGRCFSEHRVSRPRMTDRRAAQTAPSEPPMPSTAEGLPERSYPGFFSSAKSFALPAGSRFGPEGVRGYYIDLRVKAEEAGVAARLAGPARGPALGARAPVGPGRLRALPRGRGRAVAAQRDRGRASTRSRSRSRRARATACGSTASPTPRPSSCPPGGRRRWRRARARACSRGCTSRPARSAGPTPRGARSRAMRLPSAEGGVQAPPRRARVAGGVPDRPALLRAERRHLRPLGPVRRRAPRSATTRSRASSRREPTRWRRTSTAGTPATGRATTCSRTPS